MPVPSDPPRIASVSDDSDDSGTCVTGRVGRRVSEPLEGGLLYPSFLHTTGMETAKEGAEPVVRTGCGAEAGAKGGTSF